MNTVNRAGDNKLVRYLSPLGAWALAFGCSVGWGAFVMPGTTFLPIAGPVGTALGIGVGGLIMLIIGMNYHYLMNQYPDAGGTYAYAKHNFGYDHGFLNAWFLLLTYVAIIWANATALPLIARNLFGGLFQFGFHYQIAGYDIYMGEVLLAVAALVAAAVICMRGRAAARVQILMALLLFCGILLGLISAIISPHSHLGSIAPAFSPEKPPLSGVFTIIALAPWAYVGFESISHSAEELSFKPRRSFGIMAAAVVTAAVAYAGLALLAASALPEGCAGWTDYIGNLGDYSGVRGLPTFYAAETFMGTLGTVVLGFTTLGAIVTGVVGNTVASSRLLYALSEDRMLPGWMGRLNERRVPQNAILFLTGISVVLPFFGRTAISWIVDVTTVGATIAYAYTSAAAFKAARREGNRLAKLTGLLGLLISLVFVLYFLIPNLIAVKTLSTESYLILASWGILGFVFFLIVFKRDESRRLGRSPVVWVVLLALIIFTSTVWMRQATELATEEAVTPIHAFYTEQLKEAGVDIVATAAQPVTGYLREALDAVGRTLNRNSLIQTALIVFALAILFYIYYLMQKREKQMEVEKVLAEESSRAKTSFLSNMSHEIRTPMNAIIGLDNIALKDPDLTPHTREQLQKIGASAQHLLGIINDILDMSRIESGRMVLKTEEFSFRDFIDQINVMVNGQCMDKGLDFDCHIIGHVNDYYIGDDMKLKQVLINILGNAVKFTPVPGSVTFTVEQVAEFEDYCTLRFVMKDTGIGMSKEYIPKIFEAFSQENDGASNKYGSTGLGMAITKNIVDMMNGEIHVDSEKGVGTTFTVTVTLKASGRSVHSEHGHKLPAGMRILVVDDDEVACDHARLVADAIGVQADTVTGAAEALERVQRLRNQGNPYRFVLTDYRMPGMDGLELTRAIRAIDGGETCIIVLTGYSWDDMQDEARAAGVDGIMSKPLFTDSLLREMHSVLDKREDADGGDAGLVLEEIPGTVTYEIGGARVLVAEDMDINADILMDLLEMEGVDSERAENGRIAVEMFMQNQPRYYDAVLMDVRMPEMDGLEATRAIRALERADARAVPIIAMTANAFDEDVQRSLQAGMTAHLSKPVEPERLYETLDRLIHAADYKSGGGNHDCDR
ncbi:MAG: amino acid permease [Clostridia bacterium]|nr:amino acid permease [Clostridia bacterium]